ncbi:MAG: SDR family oxidoreductase [Phycisphaerae bacterium]|nr:SDR family oxidoreductase [Phycisphaerae bacterium]
MMRCLVTGGAGFIGSNLCRRLVKEGAFVRVLDNFLTGKRSNLADLSDRIELIEADMGNPKFARAAMKDIEVVFHQGAVPSVPRSVADPLCTHVNCVDATFTLLVAARDAGVRRFVYAASSSAYGDSPTLPKIETLPVDPKSPYAVSKLVGEYYAKVFFEVYGLQTISLRYFNVFGPYQDPTSQYAAAIPAFVTSILRGQAPLVYGDGEQSRDFTFVDNVVEANLCAARAPQTSGQSVNIACGERITVNNIIRQINKVLGKSVAPRYVPARAGDVKHSLADIRLAEKTIGYRPVVSFHQGLEIAINWYQTHLL